MQRSAWMRGSCLLGRLPCRTQAAGERYPTHLDDAETYAEFAGHEEWLKQTTLDIYGGAPARNPSRAST